MMGTGIGLGGVRDRARYVRHRLSDVRSVSEWLHAGAVRGGVSQHRGEDPQRLRSSPGVSRRHTVATRTLLPVEATHDREAMALGGEAELRRVVRRSCGDAQEARCRG